MSLGIVAPPPVGVAEIGVGEIGVAERAALSCSVKFVFKTSFCLCSSSFTCCSVNQNRLATSAALTYLLFNAPTTRATSC